MVRVKHHSGMTVIKKKLNTGYQLLFVWISWKDSHIRYIDLFINNVSGRVNEFDIVMLPTFNLNVSQSTQSIKEKCYVHIDFSTANRAVPFDTLKSKNTLKKSE